MESNGKEVVLAIPDTQYPFAHEDHLDFLKAVKGRFKPTRVVHLGDEIDAHALGDWEHDPDGMSAGQEHEAALADLQRLYSIFPTVMVCTSNHTARPFRRAFKFGIPKAFLKDYHEFLKAPKGWQWSDFWLIDGIRYEHGEGQSGVLGAYKAAQGNSRSTVIGHLHSFAGITYNANPEKLIYGFNVGCLIDHKKYAFAYAKKLKNKPILGAGIINKGVPTFVPMLLDHHGRWVGKV